MTQSRPRDEDSGAVLPGESTRVQGGGGEEDRVEEMPKKITSSQFHRLVSSGKLWKASYAIESGAEEMGISCYCTCQSFVKNHPQEEGREVDTNSMPVSKAEAGSTSQGQTLRAPTAGYCQDTEATEAKGAHTSPRTSVG